MHDIPKLPPPHDKDTTPTDTKDTSNPCHPDSVDFDREILQIFLSNCALSRCHNESSRIGEIVMTSYDHVIQSKVIKAFDLKGIELYERTTETKPDKVMPPPQTSHLPPDQKTLLNKWISKEAQYLTCESDCDISAVTWTKEMVPFIKLTCAGCHSHSFPSDGVVLAAYADLKKKVDMGKIFGHIKRDNGFIAIPPRGSLVSQCNVDKIRIWIEMGVPQYLNDENYL
jgi:cytochrome c5